MMTAVGGKGITKEVEETKNLKIDIEWSILEYYLYESIELRLNGLSCEDTETSLNNFIHAYNTCQIISSKTKYIRSILTAYFR